MARATGRVVLDMGSGPIAVNRPTVGARWRSVRGGGWHTFSSLGMFWYGAWLNQSDTAALTRPTHSGLSKSSAGNIPRIYGLRPKFHLPAIGLHFSSIENPAFILISQLFEIIPFEGGRIRPPSDGKPHFQFPIIHGVLQWHNGAGNWSIQLSRSTRRPWLCSTYRTPFLLICHS